MSEKPLTRIRHPTNPGWSRVQLLSTYMLMLTSVHEAQPDSVSPSSTSTESSEYGPKVFMKHLSLYSFFTTISPYPAISISIYIILGVMHRDDLKSTCWRMPVCHMLILCCHFISGTGGSSLGVWYPLRRLLSLIPQGQRGTSVLLYQLVMDN